MVRPRRDICACGNGGAFGGAGVGNGCGDGNGTDCNESSVTSHRRWRM